MAEVKRTTIQLKREAKGLSRSQFAVKIGVIPGYVKNIEKMKVQPSEDLLEKIGRELSIPYEKLVAEYRKKDGPEAAPPSRRKAAGRKSLARKAPETREQPRAAAPATRPVDGSISSPTAARRGRQPPLATAHESQDEMVAIALRSQQGVELVLRAINERNQGRDQDGRRLIRQYQQLLAELVARTARVAISEEERRADDAGGPAEPTDPFLRPSA
jgi:transcriptional regulator with XRE-family HTH domain